MKNVQFSFVGLLIRELTRCFFFLLIAKVESLSAVRLVHVRESRANHSYRFLTLFGSLFQLSLCTPYQA